MSLFLNLNTFYLFSIIIKPNITHSMSPNQTNYSINHQGGRPNNVSNFNSGINSVTDINKYCNRYSGVNINKDGNADNGTNIILGSNRDNWNGVKNGGNKYNRVDIGNNIGVNSGKNIDKDSSINNYFRNKTYKLIFKGIKSWNWKRIINIPYHLNYEQLMVIIELFKKTFKAEFNVSLWYTIGRVVKSVLFNNRDLNIFKMRVKEGLGKVNIL